MEGALPWRELRIKKKYDAIYMCDNNKKIKILIKIEKTEKNEN